MNSISKPTTTSKPRAAKFGYIAFIIRAAKVGGIAIIILSLFLSNPAIPIGLMPKRIIVAGSATGA